MDTINLVNNGKPYFFRLDIAKESGQIARFTDWIKTRVSDNGKKVPIQWYDQGTVMNVHGFYPFIEGGVGKWIKDDDTGELVPSTDVVYRTWQGTPADTSDDGIAYYTLEDQFFTKQGEFVGTFGLRDDNGNNLTSVNLVFSILGNDLRLTQAKDYYIKDLENLKRKFENDGNQAVRDFNAKIEAGTENDRQALDALRASIQANRDEQETLTNELVGTRRQIEINNVVTRPEFNNLSNQLTQQVSQMRQSGLEFFDNADKLKSAYPNGANKLCVTLDNSHQYIYDYINKQWIDSGAFNYGTIDPKITQNIYAKDADNLILNSDFIGLNMWTPWRDATTPNVYIDTSDAINGSNVAVMNGYIKDGSSNWSTLSGQTFSVDSAKHPNISFGADIWVTGINTEAGDQALVELNFFDSDNYATQMTYKVNNNSGFQKIRWENIILPKGTVKCYVAFTMCGLGQYRIRRPQINFGTSLNPYSKAKISKSNVNLLANNPIIEWEYDNGSPNYLIDETDTYHSYPTLRIKSSDSEDYHYPTSPMIKIDPGAVISLFVPFKGTRDISNSRIYVEVNQFSDYNATENTPVKYSTDFLSPDSEYKELVFNNIKLDNSTKYITVKFVTYGIVDVHVGNIALYETNYVPETNKFVNNYLVSKNHFLFRPIINWHRDCLTSDDMSADYSILDSRDQPTLKIKTPTNRVLGQSIKVAWANSNYTIRVDSRKFSFKFQYRQNIDFKQGYLEIVIRQYADKQETFNINKQINLLLPNSDELIEKEFDNIVLNSDTRYIDVVIYGEGVIDANFSNFEQVPNPTKKSNLVGQFNPSNWFLNNYDANSGSVSVTRNDDNIKLSSSVTADNYLILTSTPFDVKPNSSYTINMPSSTNYDSATGNEIYLEVEKGTTPDEAAGYNVLALFRFDQKSDNKVNSFSFTTGKDDKYINFKLVIHKVGQAEFGIISLYQGDFAVDNQNTFSLLPQLNIKSDGNITDKWQGSAFEFEDGERKVTGYLQYAMQGDSSRNYPKKNLKIKCFEDAEFKSKLKWKPKADWDKNNKFNLKANYIDATQARNLVNSKIFAKATMITPLSFDNQADLFKSQNAGQMEGFPVELYFNGNYYGLMTFNTKKDDKPFGLDSDNIANDAIEFENGASALSSPDDQLDGINCATIVHDNPSEELKANFHNLANFINTSSDEDFKAKIGTYIDIKSVFNCILWGLYSSMWDFPKKSMILLTWDSGKTFYLTLYDMDSTWNLYWDGSKLTTEDVFNFSKPDKVLVDWNNVFYKRVYALFKPKLQEQWRYLRATVWRNDQVAKAFKNYINGIPEEAYEKEQEKWQNIPSKDITDFAQIQQSIIERGNAMDKFMEGL